MLRGAPCTALSVPPISVVPLHALHCHDHRLGADCRVTVTLHRQRLSRSIALHCVNLHQRCNPLCVHPLNASAAGSVMATDAPPAGDEPGRQMVTSNSQVAVQVNDVPELPDLAPAATPAEAATAAAEIPGLQPLTAAGAAGAAIAGLDGCASQQPQMDPAASSAQASAAAVSVASVGAPTTSEPPAAAGSDAAADAKPASAGSDVDASTAPATNAEPGMEAATSVSPAARMDGAADEEEQGPPISKNQMKKRAKLQRRLEIKALKKAAEKQKKAEVQAKKKTEALARVAAMSPEQLQAHSAARKINLEERRRQDQEKQARLRRALESGQRVVVDLDFEGCMTDSELHSMAHQLQHCYAANNQAAAPFHLHFTSVTGQIQQTIQRQLAGFENWQVSTSDRPYTDIFDGEQRGNLVYLTADAEKEMEELAPDDILIIGGLVDRNRHKSICLNRAQQQGTRSARLPIGKLLQVTGSPVLTVNQVLEILLEYNSQRDWKAAFLKVVPQRKRAAAGNDTTTAEQAVIKQPRLEEQPHPAAC